MKTKGTILVLLIFLFVIHVQSQERAGDFIVLNALELFTSLEEMNPDLKTAKYKIDYADAALKESKGWWLPSIDLGGTMHQLNGAAMNTDGRIFTDLDRQNSWFGGAAHLNWDFGESQLNIQSKKFGLGSAQINLRRVHMYKKFQLADALTQYGKATEKKAAFDSLAAISFSLGEQIKQQHQAGLVNESAFNLSQSAYRLIEIKSDEAGMMADQALFQVLYFLDQDIEGAYILQLESMNEWGENTNDYTAEISQHPDLEYYKYIIETRENEKKLTYKSIALPEVYVGFRQGLFGDLFSPTGVNNQVIDNLHSTFEFNAWINWHIPLNSLFGSSTKNKLEADIKIAKSEFAAKQSELANEIKRIQFMATKYGEMLDQTSDAMRFAQRAYDQSLDRQNLRLSKAFEVYEATEHLVEANIAHIETRYMRLNSLLKLAILKRQL